MLQIWLFANFSHDHFLIRDFYNKIIRGMKQHHFDAVIIMLIYLISISIQSSLLLKKTLFVMISYKK